MEVSLLEFFQCEPFLIVFQRLIVKFSFVCYKHMSLHTIQF